MSWRGMLARLVRWLYPGLGLKRWLVLFTAGALVSGTGLGIALNMAVFERVELTLRQVLTGRGADAEAGLVAGLAVFIVGLAITMAALVGLVKSIVDILVPGGAPTAAERLYRRRYRERGPRIVAIGGGTGLPVLLRGLKEHTSNLTAIVTVADDGGSSGELRSRFGILPPGDIRNCLLALAETEPLMEKLFQHRFTQGEGLAGHPFGNLFLLAMTEVTGDFERAVDASSQVLAVSGRVFPSTLENVRLVADLADGTVAVGESRVGKASASIRRLRLEPPNPEALPEAVRAIREADAVVLGPGSLFTSVIPNLLVPAIADALRRTAAVKIYVANAMTEPGETDGFSASDHVRAIQRYGGPEAVQHALINRRPIPAALRARYRDEGAEPVRPDVAEVAALGVKPVTANLIEVGEYVRHDPLAVADEVVEIIGRGRFGPERWLLDAALFRPTGGGRR